MNALAIMETAPLLPVFDAWLATGRDLLTQRSDVEWRLADWIAQGREQFGDQAQFDFLADQLGIAPKRLKAAAAISAKFGPGLRDEGLTFDHYESVATLPVNDAMAVLKDARTHHWDDRETRVHAVRRQAEIADRSVFTDDDWDHHALMAITRAWNRAPANVRTDFMEIAQEANGGVIDA